MASSRTTVRKPRKFYCNHCMINYPVFEEETPASVNTTTSGSSNRLFLLSCFHILCQTCRVQFGHNCPICHKKIQMMEINRRMPRHMQFYFEVMRKSIDQLLNISRFQNRQDKIVSDRRLGQRRKIKEVFANDIAENNGERITFKDSKDSYQKLFGIRQRCKEEKRRRDEQHKRYFDDGPSPENEPIRFVERTPPQRRHSRHRRSSRYQYRLPISPLVTAPVYSRQSNSRTPHDSGFDHSTPHR